MGSGHLLPQLSRPATDHPLQPRPPIFETAAADSKDGVASDKPYSVFTYKEKWSIVGISSFAALFRRV
jgi:hypothetical protein